MPECRIQRWLASNIFVNFRHGESGESTDQCTGCSFSKLRAPALKIPFTSNGSFACRLRDVRGSHISQLSTGSFPFLPIVISSTRPAPSSPSTSYIQSSRSGRVKKYPRRCNLIQRGAFEVLRLLGRWSLNEHSFEDTAGTPFQPTEADDVCPNTLYMMDKREAAERRVFVERRNTLLNFIFIYVRPNPSFSQLI